MTILFRNSQRVLHAKEYVQSATPLSLVTNGDFSNGTTGWTSTTATLLANNNTLYVTGNGTQSFAQVLNGTREANKKYYCKLKIRVTNSNCTQLSVYFAGAEQVIMLTPTINTWYTFSFVGLSATTGGLILPTARYADAATANSKVMEVQEVQAIDITDFPVSQQTTAWCDANLPFRTELGTPSRWELDRSRFANNGTFSNVTWTQLPSGLWVNNFNGSTSYIEIPDSPTMRMTQGGTISCWVKANSFGEESTGRIIDKGTDYTSPNGYNLRCSGSSYAATINGGINLLTVANSLRINVWQHIILVFSSGGRKIYLNGVDITLNGGSETALPPNVAGAVRIGNRAGNTDRTFDGQISGMKITQEILTQAKVLRQFNAEKRFYGV